MDRQALVRRLESYRDSGRTWLLEPEAYALLADAGLTVPHSCFVSSAAELSDDTLGELGSTEVVVKVVSPDILHKSDVGGVKIAGKDLESVRSCVETMAKEVGRRAPDAGIDGYFIVEKIEFVADAPGTELLLSLRRDEAFGPVLTCGPGGLLAEWFGKLSSGRAHAMCSAVDFDADAAVAVIAATPFGQQALNPSRRFQEAPFSRDALKAALAGLTRLATLRDKNDHALISEIELNPVVASGGTPIALDALVRLATEPRESRLPRPIEKIGPLLHPKSAAVWGASTGSMNAGRIILQNLKRAEGLEYGRLYAVHPKAERIDGVKCVASTADLPEMVDLAVVSIPASIAPEAIEEICTLGKAQSIILIPGGFAETGDRSRATAIEDSLARSREREDRGPVLVGGNCLGIVSKHEYNTFFLPSYKLPFSDARGDELAMISQSGAYVVSFTSNLDGILFPRASISYGNEMDLTASDFLEYFLDHEPSVKVFACYMEGLQPREGERFLQLVRRARAEEKQVVAYKAGKTAAGAKAAASHTASIAGDYDLVQALLREAGAIVCETLNMFEDMSKVFTMLHRRVIRGNRVGVISNAGFECGAISDHLYDLELAAFSKDTRAKLEAVLPKIAHCGNPIDCTPMTRTAGFVEAARILADADEVDIVIVSAIPASPSLNVLTPDFTGTHDENVFGMHSLPSEIAKVFAETDKPMVVTIDSGRLYDPGVLMLERAGVPVYRKIDRASRALSTFVRAHR
jgi:acyl-CoA synthetase (NDP forming)